MLLPGTYSKLSSPIGDPSRGPLIQFLNHDYRYRTYINQTGVLESSGTLQKTPSTPLIIHLLRRRQKGLSLFRPLHHVLSQSLM